jgi:hypothetical protein
MPSVREAPRVAERLHDFQSNFFLMQNPYYRQVFMIVFLANILFLADKGKENGAKELDVSLEKLK